MFILLFKCFFLVKNEDFVTLSVEEVNLVHSFLNTVCQTFVGQWNAIEMLNVLTNKFLIVFLLPNLDLVASLLLGLIFVKSHP